MVWVIDINLKVENSKTIIVCVIEFEETLKKKKNSIRIYQTLWEQDNKIRHKKLTFSGQWW